MDTFNSFVHDVQNLSSGQKACAELGLDKHPSASVAARFGSRDKRFWQVIYHSDPFTKYQMELPKIEIVKTETVEHPRKIKLLETDCPCKRDAFVNHVIDSLKADGTIYSMPLQRNALVALGDLLQVGDLKEMGDEFDDGYRADLWGDPDCQLSEVMFFKVIISDIGRIPRPKVRGQPELTGVKTLMVHKLLRYNAANGTSTVSVNGMGQEIGDCAVPFTLHPAVIEPENLFKVIRWERAGFDLQLKLPGHYESKIPVKQMQWFSNVVPTLLKYPDGCEQDAAIPTDIPDAKELMGTLCELGLWEGPPYKITPLGKASLEVGMDLRRPQPVLKSLERGDDITKATLAQLILRVELEGFQNKDVSTSRTVSVRSIVWPRVVLGSWG
eukprot:9468499-Pyramimonas_sp.AAC.2